MMRQHCIGQRTAPIRSTFTSSRAGRWSMSLQIAFSNLIRRTVFSQSFNFSCASLSLGTACTTCGVVSIAAIRARLRARVARIPLTACKSFRALVNLPSAMLLLARL